MYVQKILDNWLGSPGQPDKAPGQKRPRKNHSHSQAPKFHVSQPAHLLKEHKDKYLWLLSIDMPHPIPTTQTAWNRPVWPFAAIRWPRTVRHAGPWAVPRVLRSVLMRNFKSLASPAWPCYFATTILVPFVGYDWTWLAWTRTIDPGLCVWHKPTCIYWQ